MSQWYNTKDELENFFDLKLKEKYTNWQQQKYKKKTPRQHTVQEIEKTENCEKFNYTLRQT
jgi:hypothetical protein